MAGYYIFGMDAQEDRAYVERNRRVFLGTADGRAVLVNMLAELGWLDIQGDQMEVTEADLVRADYARHILRSLGILNIKNAPGIIDALAVIPLPIVVMDKIEEEDGSE